MSEPKTIREYRVALRYARDEATIAKAEAARLREAIERHRESKRGERPMHRDIDLWNALEPVCPCCGERYTPAPDEIAMQCACENENCDENCPHVGHLYEAQDHFWERVAENARARLMGEVGWVTSNND